MNTTRARRWSSHPGCWRAASPGPGRSCAPSGRSAASAHPLSACRQLPSAGRRRAVVQPRPAAERGLPLRPGLLPDRPALAGRQRRWRPPTPRRRRRPARCRMGRRSGGDDRAGSQQAGEECLHRGSLTSRAHEIRARQLAPTTPSDSAMRAGPGSPRRRNGSDRSRAGTRLLPT